MELKTEKGALKWSARNPLKGSKSWLKKVKQKGGGREEFKNVGERVKGIIGGDIDGQWWGRQWHLAALSSGQDTPPLRVGLAL